ncbi:MAG: LAGLIDADG family homing endonuclease [Minisyncoccia bacterium]|jgi:intein-encoded DNA endonuclease-like protein
MIGADNQQATRHSAGESSETIRQTPLSKEEILAYLHGALHDASRNKRTRIRFVQKYPEWLILLHNLLAEIGYHSWIYKEGQNRNLYALETTCKELDFSYNPVTISDRSEKIMYVRGFFDAEGGIPRNSGKFYIQLVQKNFPKISAIKQLLADLGIKSGIIHNPSQKVDPDYWRIFILKESHRLFADKIGSWHPIKREIFRERMKI